MVEDSSEVKEQFGQRMGEKVLVLRLEKKEVKKELGEEDEQQKCIGKEIKNEGKMVNGDKGSDANSLSDDHPSSVPAQVSMETSQSSSVNAIIHPLNDQAQLSMMAEQGQATMNGGGGSMTDELRQLRAIVVANECALKNKELLNSMLMAKVEQLKKEKDEEKAKNAKLADELKLAQEKPNTMDKETETEVLPPSRAVFAAQLLGIDRQLPDEPQLNEWKEKFDQLNVKFVKVKQLYRTEQKTTARLRRKLKDKEKDATIEETSLSQLDNADRQEEAAIIESNEATTSPIQHKLQLSAQMRRRLLAGQSDFELPSMGEEKEDGENGKMLEEGTAATRHSARSAIIRGHGQLSGGGNGGRQALPTTMRMKKKGSANTVATVTGGVFKCPLCPNRVAFSGAHLLAKHQRRFHSKNRQRRYPCQQCGRSFMDSANLARHMRTHTGEKPFKCQECGRGFAQNCALTAHARVHTGERAVVCSVCQKSFTTGSNLSAHMSVHSRERPFSCQHCAKQFKHPANCRQHEKTCLQRLPSSSAAE